MNESAKRDCNNKPVLLGVTQSEELRNLKVDDTGRVIVQFIPKNELFTDSNDNSISDSNRVPCALGVTKTGKIRRIKMSEDGFLNFAFK